MFRSMLITALLVATPAAAFAQEQDDIIAPPALRAQVTVESDIVRVGDMVENAGSAAQIAIYRSPDLGTTGSLPIAQVIHVLQAHQVIGVDTRGLKSVSVTRLARVLDSKEIEAQVARALEHRNGLGEAANLHLTFDREVQDVRLEASNGGALQPVAVRYDARNGRFDVSLEIANETGNARTKLRFTGVAIEMLETAVLTRNVERGELLKGSDVVTERRPKAEVGTDAASRGRAVGMQARRSLRAGLPLKNADFGKPDLVQRDDNVTLIYEAAGIYLTTRGKAVEAGTEGDAVTVLNLQSKRTIVGTVVGRGQVVVSQPAQRLPAAETTSSIADAPVSVASRNTAQSNSNAE